MTDTPFTLLLADDDPDILSILALRLSKEGYRVITAEDGGKAMGLIREKKPDLLILDYFLPNLRGDAICRAVKDDPALKGIPIILLSASAAALPQEAVECIPTDGRLAKPFDIQVLLAKIRSLLATP